MHADLRIAANSATFRLHAAITTIVKVGLVTSRPREGRLVSFNQPGYQYQKGPALHQKCFLP